MGETSVKHNLIHGDDAFAIIDAYRELAHDETTIESLEDEFPYYAPEMGLQAVQLVRLDENVAGTYKWRGALVGATQLKREGAERLIVPSAGNHARGAVWVAKQLHMPVTTFVPSSAPDKKRNRIRELWNSHLLDIQVAGSTFDETLKAAETSPGGILLHPYGREIIPGQGTVVDDVLQLNPDTETIVLPVGGGGLVAGVLRRLHELGRGDITVLGAEATGSNSMSKSLEAGKLQAADNPNMRYGGSAVRKVSQAALDICLASPNLQLTTVPEDDVNALIDWHEDERRDLWRQKTPHLEPTSLVAVAALAQHRHKGNTVVLGTGRNEALHPVQAWFAQRRSPI